MMRLFDKFGEFFLKYSITPNTFDEERFSMRNYRKFNFFSFNFKQLAKNIEPITIL